MAIKNEYVLNFKSKGVNKTKSEVDKLDKSEKNLEKSSLKLKAGIAVAGVAILAMGKHAISTAAQFETLKVRLISMYGSVNAGTKAFQNFARVAATTPFAVKSVVEAGAQLKAFGLDAEANIKGVADLAAFMGTDVVEAANAMGRAFAGGAGAADVLRERGILNLLKDFKGIDDITKLTLPEFRKALTEMIEDPTAGIAGATSRLSETFEGSYSNMMDSVDRLSASIGDALLPTVKSVTDGITSMINSILGGKDEFDTQIEQIRTQSLELKILASEITTLNIPQKQRLELIRNLKKEYPQFLKDISAEEATDKDIAKSLEDINDQNKIRIDMLLKEQMIKQLLNEESDALKSLSTSQREATNTLLDFGKIASQTGSNILETGNINERFASQLDVLGNTTGGSIELFNELKTGAGNLYNGLRSGTLGLTEYKKGIEDLITQEKFQKLSQTGQITILKEYQQAQQDVIEQQKDYKLEYDTTREAVDGLTKSLHNLKEATKSDEEVKPTKDDTEYEELQERRKQRALERFRDFSSGIEEPKEIISSFSDALQGVDIGLRQLPESTANSLKGAAKFGAGMKAITKDLFAQDSAIRDQVIGSMGAIAMASAGSKAEQLKVQKMMIKANIAKGIIDIFTDPAPTGPLEIAKAVAMSAGLVARGISQTKTIDEQIAGINASKGSIGGTQTRFAQYGMNEVVDQATPIVAGEAGAELVQITPLEGANVDGPQGGGNIVITGNVLSRDFVQGELIDELREAIRQGYDFR